MQAEHRRDRRRIGGDRVNPFSILMFCFSGALLLYAGVLALAKNPDLIPRSHAVQMKDPKAYARAFAGMIALAALAPLGSGLYGLVSVPLGAFMLIPNFAACIWIGTRVYKDTFS